MIDNRDKKIWLFNSGSSFSGNPKWLFLYMKKFRRDIRCIWLAENKTIYDLMKQSGYETYLIRSEKGKAIQRKAGVYVVNQVKEYIPESLYGVLILNLWHGVGGKTIERKLNFSYIQERVAKKYIKYNEIYVNNQIFLVTSEYMEKHFKLHCGLEDEQLIRAGYPCNLVPKMYPDLKQLDKVLVDKLTSCKRAIVYTPTYRYDNPNDFIKKAIPKINELKNVLIEKDILFIFKMHPMMESDLQYQIIKEEYCNERNFLFWDNSNDIYNYFEFIDTAIIDYSSMYYDMLASGVKNYIRYVFDFENKKNIEGLVFDYFENTTGEICENFEQLLETLNADIHNKKENKAKEVMEKFWGYSDDKAIDQIIEKTLSYEVRQTELKPLYSFDIFDTLIQRKTLQPVGIFYYVKEMLNNSNLEYSSYFINNYVKIRTNAEANVREFYNKSQALRGTDKIEITFDDIFKRMADVFHLNKEQVEFLKTKEIEAELLNCEIKKDIAEYAEELVLTGNDVVLISDMYLPKEIIKKLLSKVSPTLANLPLYVSSEYGNRKLNKKLFIDVYHSIDFKKYSKWKHFGDNNIGDGKSPKSLGIESEVHKISNFNKYERFIINNLKSYDSYVLANLLARFREKEYSTANYFGYSIVSLYFVPYVNWVVNDAVKKGLDTLYFISRDGHHLKNIAEQIIEKRNLKLKVKYIYGSRKVWRIPSFVNDIDDAFFGEYGNLTSVTNYQELKQALWINDEDFNEIFADLEYVKNIKTFTVKDKEKVISYLKNSAEFKKYLLNISKIERHKIQKYLMSEIDFNENYAFVEFWGRGYTQDCLHRILNDIPNIVHDKTAFYYARSIYPSIDGSIRFNFTTSKYTITFIEAIFANIPYKSIENFTEIEGEVVPIIQENPECEIEIFNVVSEMLAEFTNDYLNCEFLDEKKLNLELFELALKYYHENQSDIAFIKCLSILKYNEGMYGQNIEFARGFTYLDIIPLIKGQNHNLKTHSMRMSLAKSPRLIKKAYEFKKSNKFKRFYKIYCKTFRRIIKKFV